MTKGEKEYIYDEIDNVTVLPSRPMNLEELEAYIEGYKDARNAFLDKFEECYFNVKTDGEATYGSKQNL